MPGKTRWYVPTVGMFLLALLLLQGALFLSTYTQWFWFNKQKGYTVLITIAATAASLLLVGAWVLVSRFTRYKSQFSLATLMSTALVMAIPCGWLVREISLARQQRLLLDRLGPSSSYAIYDPRLGGNPLPAWYDWEQLGLGQEFFSDPVHANCPAATDADAAGLARMKATSLVLGESKITDQGVAVLARGMPQLRSIRLADTSITDTSLVHLPTLHELVGIDLTRTPVTDAGIQQLKGLTELRSLNLVGTQITDASMEFLKEHSKLTKLELPANRVSPRAIEEFKRVFPQCRVYRR